MSLTDAASRYQRSDDVIHTIALCGRFEFDQWFILVGMKSKGVWLVHQLAGRISLTSAVKYCFQ